jgi:ppGpp synthetase/RelA/SpoT-type nucleotidyltranferase
MGDRNDDIFGYAEFGSWYDAYRSDTLEPALDRAMDALQRELDDALSERDLARIRSLSGRVKSKRRTWRKVNQPRYRRQIRTVDDIPTVIDDLVGMRLTCTNLRDIEMVQVALESLPREAGKRRPLGLDPESERDYVEHPKQSGYRGWHVNLAVNRDGAPVTCELQVRTLLQDSWGELTHEDTYSKAGESPPLVEVLSTRMADLLATLDDIAEDLRNELDRIDEAIVAETAGQVDEPGDDELAVGPAADAADLLRERWRSLDRPLELASLAWALQHEFGAEVSDDWFGFRTFKRFLRAAIPDGEISSGRQAYLLPPGAAAEGHDAPSADTGPVATGRAAEVEAGADADEAADTGPGDGSTTIPEEARELRRVDRGFPLVETEQWRRIYDHLAEAWRRVGAGPPSTRMVNQLTRSARDRARATGDPLSRRHLDHVAKAVLSVNDSGEPLDADRIGDAFASTVLDRMADLRIVKADDAASRARVGRWLLG